MDTVQPTSKSTCALQRKLHRLPDLSGQVPAEMGQCAGPRQGRGRPVVGRIAEAVEAMFGARIGLDRN